MEPTPQLIEQLEADKIEAARKMTPEQKLTAGAELFDYACEISKAGIRMQFPDADEARVLEILRQRVELGRRLESRE